jgi:hypothetical protein
LGIDTSLLPSPQYDFGIPNTCCPKYVSTDLSLTGATVFDITPPTIP